MRSRHISISSYAVLQATHISAGQFLANDPAEVAYIAAALDHARRQSNVHGVRGCSYRWHHFLLSADSIWAVAIGADSPIAARCRRFSRSTPPSPESFEVAGW